jgi:hypothetical protein
MQRSNSPGRNQLSNEVSFGLKSESLSRMTLLLYCKLPEKILHNQIPIQKGKEGSEHG